MPPQRPFFRATIHTQMFRPLIQPPLSRYENPPRRVFSSIRPLPLWRDVQKYFSKIAFVCQRNPAQRRCTHIKELFAMNMTANLSAWPEDERDRKRAPAPC
jgi:hypothetical protein